MTTNKKGYAKYPTLIANGVYYEDDTNNYTGSINLHKGKKYWYWFIENHTLSKPERTNPNEVPDFLKSKRISFEADRRLKRTALGRYR